MTISRKIIAPFVEFRVSLVESFFLKSGTNWFKPLRDSPIEHECEQINHRQEMKGRHEEEEKEKREREKKERQEKESRNVKKESAKRKREKNRSTRRWYLVS